MLSEGLCGCVVKAYLHVIVGAAVQTLHDTVENHLGFLRGLCIVLVRCDYKSKRDDQANY